MSAVYNIEPPPTAKVLLQTTAGDILLELFAKQTPLASRNFLQHCLDGYYENSLFHRLVPGFIIQAGDPTGTGAGGESAFENGAPFADEFHTRLKFNRRGLLGMANAGKDDNSSQFFITLAPAKELDGRNTMFGRVEGDTIFNVLKMAEGELAEEGGDRPLYPYKITGAEILVNPFEDMVKRTRTTQITPMAEKKDRKKGKRKAGKGMLSFGGDEGEDGEDVVPVVKKPKFNPKLVDAGVAKSQPKDAPQPKAQRESREQRRAEVLSEKDEINQPPPKANGKSSQPAPSEPEDESDYESPPPTKSTSVLDRTNAQIAELKASMRRDTKPRDLAPEKKKSALEAMIPANSRRGRRRRADGGGNEDEALDLFNSFKSKLEAVPATQSTASKDATTPNEGNADVTKEAVNGDEDDETTLCDLHFIANCQSCTKWDEQAEEDEVGDDGWMSHSLSFAKDRLGKDLEWKRKNEEELVVIDPREKAKELGDKRRDKDRGKDRRWDRDRGSHREREKKRK